MAVELLCALTLVAFVGLPLFEGVMGAHEWALLLTLLPVWGLIAWARRAGRARAAWLGTVAIAGVWVWTAWDSLRWWNANMAP